MKYRARRAKHKRTKVSVSKREISSADLKLRYKFWILLGVLFLAGIAMVLHVESPVVWTFLYGIGGWAAFTIPHVKNY